MKFIYYSLCFLVLAVFDTNVLKAQSTRVDTIINDFYNHPKMVLVAAHRAAHLQHPENSLAAIEAAIKMGVDIIEIDVHKTKDNVIVLLHDETIDRTTNKTGKVKKYTYAELKKIPLLLNGKPTKERIPTFREALLAAKGKVMIDVDFKLSHKKDVRHAIRIIQETGTLDQIILFIYDYYKYIPFIKSLAPSIAIMPRAYDKKDVLKILKKYDVPVIHIDDSFYDDDFMQKISDHHVRIWSNALGKYDDMEKEKPGSGYDKLRKMNRINVIQTDYPANLLQYLKKRGLHR